MTLQANPDIEGALLGIMLVDPRVINDVLEVITPEAMYKEEHKVVFEAILVLKNDHKPIDMLTVTSFLRKNGKLEGIGGAYFITSLCNRASSSSLAPFYALELNEKYRLRELHSLGNLIASNALKQGSESVEIISSLEKELTKLSISLYKKSFISASELFKDALNHNDVLLNRGSAVSGVPTGLTKLDSETNGFQNGDLIILAARPSMGKTALALQLASQPALQGDSTAFFSLEMSNKQLYARMIAQMANVPINAILRYGMNEQQLQAMLANQSELCSNVYFDDTGGITLFELCNKARKLKREKDIKLIVIDYLQLINNPIKGGNREQEISSISRGLKTLAKELDIPIIALAQLSRASEKRGAAALPMLSDLRESGSIEQDADMVMFIYRPEYYGITEFEDGSSTAGKADIIISKHRNGGLATLGFNFDGSRTKFFDLQPHYNEPPY